MTDTSPVSPWNAHIFQAMKESVQKLSMTGSEFAFATNQKAWRGAEHNQALLLQFPTSCPIMLVLDFNRWFRLICI